MSDMYFFVNTILDNISTILLGLIVLIVVVGIVIKLVKDRASGKKSCNCGCEDCPSRKECK